MVSGTLCHGDLCKSVCQECVDSLWRYKYLLINISISFIDDIISTVAYVWYIVVITLGSSSACFLCRFFKSALCKVAEDPLDSTEKKIWNKCSIWWFSLHGSHSETDSQIDCVLIPRFCPLLTLESALMSSMQRLDPPPLSTVPAVDALPPREEGWLWSARPYRGSRSQPGRVLPPGHHR